MHNLLSNIAMGLWRAAKTNCRSAKRRDSKLKWFKKRENAMRKPEGLLLLQPNEKQTHKLPADKTGRAHCLTLKTAKSWPK